MSECCIADSIACVTCSYSNITKYDLAVPDTHCSPEPGQGYQCPSNMKCVELTLAKEIMGFNGFDTIGELEGVCE